jgi:hypothetical protein
MDYFDELREFSLIWVWSSLAKIRYRSRVSRMWFFSKRSAKSIVWTISKAEGSFLDEK